MFGDVTKHFEEIEAKADFDDITVVIRADNAGVHCLVSEFGTELGCVGIAWAPDPIHALADKHGGTWGAHPDYPVENWTYEIGYGDTRLGYWEWVDVKLQAAEEGSPE